ncbi:MAG: oligosaccharide flippase family protein [Deltaproteobacteria bacterium]
MAENRSRKALTVDLIFNYGSLGIVAVGGLLANIVVARYLGQAALGVFNQAYAVYIAASQLAVGGVHISVLRSVAQADGNRPEQARLVASGLALSLALGSAVAAVLLLGRHLLGAALGSPEVASSLALAALALVPFAVNKTLLSTLNGLARMRAYALLQATRLSVLLLTLSTLAWLKRPPAELTLGLLLAELCVFCAALPLVMRHLQLRPAQICRSWLDRHLAFGTRGLLSGVFLELNTRIDVLAIGLFLSDQDVGSYSIAAVFAEGLYQCLIVVRNQMNPVLAQLVLAEDPAPVRRMVRTAWRYLYPGMALTYLAGLGALHVVLSYQLRLPDPGATRACYLILGAGVLAVSGFVPFDGALLHAGRPAHYTLLTFLVALSNLVLNLALIPWLGIVGAALGTALALGLSILYLNSIMRWQLGFDYLTRTAAPGP